MLPRPLEIVTLHKIARMACWYGLLLLNPEFDPGGHLIEPLIWRLLLQHFYFPNFPSIPAQHSLAQFMHGFGQKEIMFFHAPAAGNGISELPDC